MTQEAVSYPIINVQEPEYCKLNIHYETGPDSIKIKQDEAVSALKGVKLPGFRAGKAPEHAIKSKLRKQINQYVARELATTSIDEIIFETNIKALGQPKFSNVSLDKTFSCDIEIYKRPEVKIENLKFDIPEPDLKLDEEALVEKSLYNLRMRVGDTKPYEEDDCVILGDQVTMSFSATIEGEAFDGSSVEGELYTIGENRFSGFDTYLLGMKAGETREFDFVFESGDLKDKTAKFSVTIHMGVRKIPHDINEEFFTKMGVKDLQEMLGKLRGIATQSISEQRKLAIREQAGIKLIEHNKFEIPKFLLEAEKKHVASSNPANPLSEEELDQQAANNISLALILDTIRDKEPDSVLSEADARNVLVQDIINHGQNPDALLSNNNARLYIAMLLQQIRDNFTLQWVADQANIIS